MVISTDIARTSKGRIPLHNGPSTLSLSYDRKVSPSAAWRPDYGGLWYATTPNSFGLPAGISCPGKTPFCEACYGAAAERRPVVRNALRRNWDLLQTCGDDVASITDLLTEMLGRYKTVAEKRGVELLFRVHWDGDFYSTAYAEAWALAMQTQPDVQFWTYTRTFDVAPILVEVKNLTTYLSVDAQNAATADAVLAEHPSLHVALCSDTFANARSLLARKRIVTPCPENAKTIPLVGDDGRGACVSCGICPDGRRDIAFATTHSEGTSVLFSRRLG